MRPAAMALTLILVLGPALPGAAREEADVRTGTPPPVQDPALRKIEAFIVSRSIDRSRRHWKELLPRPPQVGFDPERRYFWHLETSQGPLRVRLMPEVAPMHVSSTIYLTLLGFYDGTVFHRVIPGFMAQGGDPRGTGSGGPGYEYDGELREDVRHDRRGLLSMANRGPGTDGSQFFLTFEPTPWLDGKHTIFGEVVEGDGTLGKIEACGTPDGQPSETLQILRARVTVE